MSISKGEIRQWWNLNHYGCNSQHIHEKSNNSWLNMPLITIACERVGLSLPNAEYVPYDQKKFWEDQFLSEILEIEQRIRNNVREPSLASKGDPKFAGVKQRSLKRFLLNPNSWEGPENLISGLDFLILGSDLYHDLYDKKMEILDEVGIKYEEKPLIARVSGARVSGARVSGARVSGARVSGARVSGERVSGARVSGAKVSGARVSGARVRKSKSSSESKSKSSTERKSKKRSTGREQLSKAIKSKRLQSKGLQSSRMLISGAV
jgi:hypothetical protein